MERINLNSIKKESVRAVFAAVTGAAGKEQISRAEIAEITDLSLMTVGKVVDALLERDIVRQCKEVKNAAGRRAGLVSLNTDKFFMVIDLTSRTMSMTVIDLALNTVDTVTYAYNNDFYYEENLYIFLKNVKIYILRNLNMENAIGIGVLLPGNYCAESDTVEGSRIPELASTHIKAIIEEVLRAPVAALEKDVLTAAVSNLEALEAEHIRSAAYICIGETLSGALISDGKLLYGRGEYAGDIGRVRTESGKTLRQLFEAHGLREDTMNALAEALAYEIVLFDPALVFLENCTQNKPEHFPETLIDRIKIITGLGEDRLPEIRIAEDGVRHAYRGLALRMRSAWIQNEIH